MTDDFPLPGNQKEVYGNVVLWTLGILLLIGIVTGIVWGWRYATAPTAGKISARQQINSGSFRIAAYNHFFDACAAIQGLDGQLAAQQQQLPTATGDDRSRIETNIAGIEGARAQAVAEYNADARKGYTIGQFRSSGLPFQLPLHIQKGSTTSCTA